MCWSAQFVSVCFIFLFFFSHFHNINSVSCILLCRYSLLLVLLMLMFGLLKSRIRIAFIALFLYQSFALYLSLDLKHKLEGSAVDLLFGESVVCNSFVIELQTECGIISRHITTISWINESKKPLRSATSVVIKKQKRKKIKQQQNSVQKVKYNSWTK